MRKTRQKRKKDMHRPGVEPGSYSRSLMGTVDDNRYTSGAVFIEIIHFTHKYEYGFDNFVSKYHAVLR